MNKPITKLKLMAVHIDDYPKTTLVVNKVNRKRLVTIWTYTGNVINPSCVVSTEGQIVISPVNDGNYIPVHPRSGIRKMPVGPNQQVFASWINPEDSDDKKVLYLMIEDSVNEGIYTDSGSDVEGVEQGGGDNKAESSEVDKSGTSRMLKRK